MVRFIPAENLKRTFDLFGHFYSVKLSSTYTVQCRSVLELVDKDYTPSELIAISKRKPDTLFIMMNPGSSRPLVEVNNHIHAKAIHAFPISLVETRPDTTQYQVMRLMHFCDW